MNPLAVDGGTYNTNGTYSVVITLHATSPTSGTAYMTINSLDQGFETDGDWKTMELSPAGMNFTGDMTKMQVFYGLYGYGADHTAQFTSITVDGCLADAEGPITSNVVADLNPVAVGGSATVTANVDDSTTGGSNILSAEYNVGAGAWTAMSASDGTFDSVSEEVTATFVAPSVPGVYDDHVCVRAKDTACNTGDPECIMLVVYDPSGGFVTGGGWIWSDTGNFRVRVQV